MMGACTLFGGYLAVALVSRGGLGAGDVRLVVLIGDVLGWHSWPALAMGTVLGFVVTAAYSASKAAFARARHAMPHNPGMLAGALVALLL